MIRKVRTLGQLATRGDPPTQDPSLASLQNCAWAQRAAARNGFVDLRSSLVNFGARFLDIGVGFEDLGPGFVDFGARQVDLGVGLEDLGAGFEISAPGSWI